MEDLLDGSRTLLQGRDRNARFAPNGGLRRARGVLQRLAPRVNRLMHGDCPDERHAEVLCFGRD